MPDCSSLLPPARVIHEQVARNERECPIETQPETAATPEGFVSLADALAKLTTLLPGLADALGSPDQEPTSSGSDDPSIG